MFRQVWVYAYDVLDEVQVIVRFQTTADANSHSAVWETVAHTAFRGTGEPDDREWMKDALVAALEKL